MAEGSLELKPQGWSPRQGSWLGVTGVLVVAGAGAGLLAVFGEHPFWASCLIIAATDYALWFAGANMAGVLLWLPAAVTLSAALGMPSHHDFFPIDVLIGLGASLLSLPSGAVFLVASVKNRRRCAGNCAGFMFVVFTALIFWFPGRTLQTYYYQREATQDAQRTILALHCLAGEIDAIRARLGRVPKDDAELAALRGKPLPPHVHYVEQGANKYVLLGSVHQLWGRSDLFGWGLDFFGPDGMPRLRVEGF